MPNDDCVMLHKSRHHGTGVFARRPIDAGERILAFTGPILDLIDVNREWAGTHCEADLLQIDFALWMALEEPGRLVNHSCEPNAGIRDDTQLVALRAIPAGEEIVYDYATTMLENAWTMQCHCGSMNCRGHIGDFTAIDPALQGRLLRSNIVQRFISRAMGRESAGTLTTITGHGQAKSRVETDRLYLRSSRIHEFGLHARTCIHRGTAITRFRGPRVHEAPLTAEFESFLQIDERAWIGHDENLLDYLNHSCDPNARIALDEEKDAWLVVLGDVAADEEITIDYSSTSSEPGWQMDCRCNARECRRCIGDFASLPAKLQARYCREAIAAPFLIRKFSAPTQRVTAPAR